MQRSNLYYSISTYSPATFFERIPWYIMLYKYMIFYIKLLLQL